MKCQKTQYIPVSQDQRKYHRFGTSHQNKWFLFLFCRPPTNTHIQDYDWNRRIAHMVKLQHTFSTQREKVPIFREISPYF